MAEQNSNSRTNRKTNVNNNSRVNRNTNVNNSSKVSRGTNSSNSSRMSKGTNSSNSSRTNKEVKTRNSSRVSKEAIYQVIEVRRYTSLYVVIDKIDNIILAKIAVNDNASDLTNSRLRDNIVRLCYQYGKEIGRY